MLLYRKLVVGSIGVLLGAALVLALNTPKEFTPDILHIFPASAWTAQEEAQFNQLALALRALEKDASLLLATQEDVSITKTDTSTGVPDVPFYSQFTDISDPSWKKIGCGVASLAMLIEHYQPGTVSVDALLREGINAGAYLRNAGWTHQGLANLATAHGLESRPYDLAHMSMAGAYAELEKHLEKGPVIASVYYTFTPGHPIPHLAVINGVEGNTVYYNDPASDGGGKTISVDAFKAAWKKRFIVVRS